MKLVSWMKSLLNKSKQESSKPPQNNHCPKGDSALSSRGGDSNQLECVFDAPPKIPDNPFPPRLKSAVEIACKGTEAHPMAVAIHFLVFFSAHIGQRRYVRIGNEKQGLNFYAILVGDSGKVKGTAESQARVIAKEATNLLEKKYDYQPPRMISGLSSGEGLIESIKDPKDESDDTGCLDKRLLIVESEYSKILEQQIRNGNTLSAELRDAYDGKTLSNATINSRIASSPHISIMGHITRDEFVGHKSFKSQSTNGSLNRNLIIYAHREVLVAIPRRYTDEEVKILSEWFAESIYRARDENNLDNYQTESVGKEVMMSVEALALIEKEYKIREKAQDEMPGLLSSLASRQRVFVWRISAIFALMSGTDTIAVEHVRYAYRWLDYSLNSIRYLLRTAEQEANQRDNIALSNIIYDFLLKYNHGRGATTTEINRIGLQGNINTKKISSALKLLIESNPPKVEQLQLKREGPGRKPTLFKPIKTK